MEFLSLTELLAADLLDRLLLNIDRRPDHTAIIARCQAFAARQGADALIISVLYQPGMAMAHHVANAALWAYTRQAALELAPRGLRVNAIGLGASPAGPFEAQEQAGRASAPAPAAPGTAADIARTIRFIADCPSITGQIIRLGA